MFKQEKKNVIGIGINPITYDIAVDRIIAAAKKGQRCTVSALATHGVMTGALDKEHRYRLNHLDLILPDGQPVKWALNALYKCDLKDRVYGPTLTLKVCEKAAEERIPLYFYGSKSVVLEKLLRNLKSLYPSVTIAGYQPSRFRRLTASEKNGVVQTIRSSKAKIVFVGLGCPRQEVWAYEFGDDLQMPTIAVGAAFDFHAGMLDQAPIWIQKWGMEWFYRLIMEPKRLFWRYLVNNVLYVLSFLMQFFGIYRFNRQGGKRPQKETLFG